MSFVFLERLEVEYAIFCYLFVTFKNLVNYKGFKKNILNLGNNFLTNNNLLNLMNLL